MLEALRFSQAVNRETEMLDGGFGSEPVQSELTIPPADYRATNPIHPAPLSREPSIFVTGYHNGLAEIAALARVSCYAMTFTVDQRYVGRVAGRT
jgi:hypothetical protein